MSTPISLGQLGFLQHRPADIVKGRYEVLSHLGGGNFGSVYRVRDGVVGNFLACKEMHVLNDPATGKDERALALDLFKREALNLATLRHPNIPAAYFEQEPGSWHVCPRCGLDYPDADVCPIHGAHLLEINQRHYLMMDFIDGATLEELAIEYSKQRGRPLPEADCLQWIAQIGSALRSLHKLGVVHRDIKPDNITIRADDNVAMLLDFGLTKKIEEAGHYGTVRISGTGRFGTPGYAPPDPQEQQNPEPRSDIYALGMTLGRLLTGRDPQDEDDLRELTSHAPRYFNNRISPEVERIIQTATATKKADRYANVEELLSDLNELRPAQSSTRFAPPFTFADGFRVRDVKGLARAVETYPQEALNYLWNGMLAEWLRLNGFAAPALAAEDATKRFQKHPQRALEIFRRSLYGGRRTAMPQLQIEPALINLGSVPSGDTATATVRIRNIGAGFSWGRVLVEDIPNRDPLLLVQIALPGLIVAPVWEGNDVSLEVTLDTSQAPLGGQSGALLFETEEETVRVPVSYTVAPLPLHTVPQTLDFGIVVLGTSETRRLIARRLEPGKGQPRGTIRPVELPHIEAPERFQGEEAFHVTVRADKPQTVARYYAGALQLDTNGGRLQVPVSYRIVMPLSRWLSLVLGTSLGGALAFFLARLGYMAIDPAYASAWLWNPHNGAYPFTIRGLGPLVAGALLGLALGFRLQRDSRVDLLWKVPLPFFGLFAGIASGWGLAWLAHWGVWVFGDWLLFPLRPMLGRIGNYAPPAWACLGAVGGFLWGWSRALAAVGNKSARIAVLLVFGLGFFALLLNAMLSTP